MQTLLIVGIDTLVGSNVALALSETFDVVGLAPEPPDLDPVRTAVCSWENANELASQIRSMRPDWIIYCGPMSRSSWEPAGDFGPVDQQATVHLAREAHHLGCGLTVISTDAVFGGPWLFHDEDEQPQAESWLATTALAIEAAATEHCPQALVVRTNAYGWTPGGQPAGLIERISSALQDGTPMPLEADRGATPILASDLAFILSDAYRKNLTGLYHIAGSERTSPYHLAVALADVLSLSGKVIKPVSHEPSGGTASETSLRVRRIHTALGKAMPMLRDGLMRLKEEREDGFADRIHAASRSAALRENVA